MKRLMQRWLEKIGQAMIGKRLDYLEDAVFGLRPGMERNALLLAQLHIQRVHQIRNIKTLDEVEFKVWSQSGEDGIIQYLLTKIPVPNDAFIEFGVEDYREANSRFLLINNKWRGLVMDSDERHIRKIKQEPLYARHELKARHAFVTRENVDDLVSSEGFAGDIGLLSIDIDGNDYWVWEAIQGVSPRIVICEYNSVFGATHAVTVPYAADFDRAKAHYSYLYFGASLPALCRLAEKKGYVCVGCNSEGTNAFFVRKDVAKALNHPKPEEAYRCSRFRESRDARGALSYLSGQERLKAIKDLEVFDLDAERLVKIADLFSLK